MDTGTGIDRTGEGSLGRCVVIDLTRKRVTSEPIPLSLRRMYLGGRGLNVYYLLRYLPPGTDPFDPGNPLILGTGFLNGTPVPSSSRMNCTSRSPETFHLGDANCGGFFGPELKWAEIDHLILLGKCEERSYLWIHDGEVDILPADDLWGMMCSEVQVEMKRRHHPDVQCMVIGPAGENLVRMAALRHGPKNTAARCGLGAVMGSKNLKGICVRGEGALRSSDPHELLEAAGEAVETIGKSRITPLLGTLGTPLLYEISNRLGAIRTNNSRLNMGSEGLVAEEVEKHVVKMLACQSCPVHCRHRNDQGGEGPEYSTLGICGSNLGLESSADLIRVNNLCNELGLDTSSMGTILAWAIELYERGVIDRRLAGRDLGFGDVEMVLDLIRDTAYRRGFGSVLAESTRALSVFGKDAMDCLIAVKGLPQSDPHDVRYMRSFALGLATASRGADHLRSRPTLDFFFKLPVEAKRAIYGEGYMPDPLSFEGKEHAVVWSEMMFAVADSAGICKFITQGFNSPHMMDLERYIACINPISDRFRLTREDLERIGRNIVDLERAFIYREGMTSADDTLPRRYLEEPAPLGPAKGQRIDRNELRAAVRRYYALHGWGPDGSVPEERLRELGILGYVRRGERV